MFLERLANFSAKVEESYHLLALFIRRVDAPPPPQPQKVNQYEHPENLTTRCTSPMILFLRAMHVILFRCVMTFGGGGAGLALQSQIEPHLW